MTSNQALYARPSVMQDGLHLQVCSSWSTNSCPHPHGLIFIEAVEWQNARKEAPGTSTSSVSSQSWWWRVEQLVTMSTQLRSVNVPCSSFTFTFTQVISVLPHVQCENVTIPDMIGDEGHRSLHNLAYHPRGDGELLTCNSIHQLTETTCDSWTYGQEVNGERKWSSGHSSPHKENSLRNFILYTKRVI